MPQGLRKGYFAIVKASSDEWSERFGEVVRIDVVQSEIAFLG